MSVLILSLSLFGVLKRRKWARDLILAWFAFGILYSLTELFLFLAYKKESLALYQLVDTKELILRALISDAPRLIVNSVICLYVYSRKTFFSPLVSTAHNVI